MRALIRLTPLELDEMPKICLHPRKPDGIPLGSPGPITKFAKEPDNVMDHRFVRDQPAKTGVKSSQSGNSSH
jgi:hypothetical protein